VGLKAMIRGLGVGGRKREIVGITVRGKRVGSWGKKVKAKKERVKVGEKKGRKSRNFLFHCSFS